MCPACGFLQDPGDRRPHCVICIGLQEEAALGSRLVRRSGFGPAPTDQLVTEASQPLFPGLIHGDKFHSRPPPTLGVHRETGSQRGGDLVGARPAHCEVSWSGCLLLALAVGILTRRVLGARLAASWRLACSWEPADTQPAWGRDRRDTDGDGTPILGSRAASQSPLCSCSLLPTL